MKKIGIIICLAVFTFSFSFAQEEKERIREKIKARKIAFITDKVGLTSKEAETFWPIYNEYATIKKDIRQQRLPMKKVAKLIRAEQKYKEWMLEQVKNR